MTEQQEGIKFDKDKLRLAEMVMDFKSPLESVCRVWEFGANKYKKSNWKFVENAEDRYTNAMLRHLVAEEDFIWDDESKLLHAAHVAWNALARLHFIKEKLIQAANSPLVRIDEPVTEVDKTEQVSDQVEAKADIAPKDNCVQLRLPFDYGDKG